MGGPSLISIRATLPSVICWPARRQHRQIDELVRAIADLARVAHLDGIAREAFDRLPTVSPPMAPDTTDWTSATLSP
jgi:hypothetical protein